MTRAPPGGRPPPIFTAAMRWPSTSTSPENGAAPLPSKIIALTISVLAMGSSSGPTIARGPVIRCRRRRVLQRARRTLPRRYRDAARPAWCLGLDGWHDRRGGGGLRQAGRRVGLRRPLGAGVAWPQRASDLE